MFTPPATWAGAVGMQHKSPATRTAKASALILTMICLLIRSAFRSGELRPSIIPSISNGQTKFTVNCGNQRSHSTPIRMVHGGRRRFSADRLARIVLVGARGRGLLLQQLPSLGDEFGYFEGLNEIGNRVLLQRGASVSLF